MTTATDTQSVASSPPAGGKQMLLQDAKVVVQEVVGSFMELWRQVTKPVHEDDHSDDADYIPVESAMDDAASADEFEIIDTPTEAWERAGGEAGCCLRNLDVLPSVGSLLEQGYYISPSLAQLDALCTEDPESLGRVENFRLGHPRYGYIAWQEPVDLAGVDLEAVVKLRQGEVQLYDSKTLPPMGSGLNRRSLVYLFNIVAYHPRSQQAVRDGEELVAFTNRLVRECHKNGVLYKNYLPQKGIWVFEAPPKAPPARSSSPLKKSLTSSASCPMAGSAVMNDGGVLGLDVAML